MRLITALQRTQGRVPATSIRRVGSALFFCLLPVFAATAFSQYKLKRVVQAVRVQQAPRLDGNLGDPCWQRSAPAGDFRQRDPREGEPATEKTEVRIVYDWENLYLGIRCYDEQPDRIVATQLQRDGSVRGDDYIAFVLDTYHDRRNAFYFAVNPLGARFDALVTDEGNGFNHDWDGVWDARSKIDSLGWVTEIVIPFRTLRYRKEAEQVWGVNFRRVIRRKNEEVLWAAYVRNHGLMRISKAGVLHGLRGLPEGARAQLLPYFTGGAEGLNSHRQFLARTGGDIKLGLTPTLTLDLTAHTDFAQVEVDRARINLTRFSLYYPEKRDFFLEGAGVFRFGSPYSGQLFYSRRIGLSESREPIPILGGVRMTGKAGPYNLGLLSIATDGKGQTPRTLFNVARVKRDIFGSSSAGFIVTDKEQAGGRWDRAGGVDFTYLTGEFLGTRSLEVNASVAGTQSSTDRRGDWARKVLIDYPNDRLDIFVSHLVIGEDFHPAVGFVRRTGIRRSSGQFKWKPRPGVAGTRHLEFKVEGDYISDLKGRMLERSFEIRPLGALMESGEAFEFNIQPEYVFLHEDWNVFGDVIFPKGGYTFTHYEIQFETADKRSWWAGLFLNWGPYYAGHRNVLGVEWLLRPSSHLSVVGDYSRHRVYAYGTGFTTHEWSARINFNVSPRWGNRLFVQWNNEDRELVANFRLRWIPRLGSNFYFVISQVWHTSRWPWGSRQSTVASKLVYLVWL